MKNFLFCLANICAVWFIVSIVVSVICGRFINYSFSDKFTSSSRPQVKEEEEEEGG